MADKEKKPDSVTVEPETLTVTYDSKLNDVNALILAAVENKVDADQLGKLVALKERVDREFARTQFVAALAAFQSECPIINKTGRNAAITRGGYKDGSPYARLEEDIQPIIHPVLARNHLTYSFDTKTEGEMVSATVTLTHVAGHSSTSTFSGGSGSNTGKVNSQIQKIGAAMTYAKRMALINVLGLRVGEVDDEGIDKNFGIPISDEQFEELNKEIDETNADLPKLLAHFRVADLSEITIDQYVLAKNILKRRRQQQ